MIKIAISYFYQIRNFKPNMIPVSTAISDPLWYRPRIDEEYYIDKRGIPCGLRYDPLIVQLNGIHGCPCEDKSRAPNCPTMLEYRSLLEDIDFDKMITAFEFCGNKFKKELQFEEEPIIVLIVYEVPSNPCSERWALIEYFQAHGIDCNELSYPIV